MADLYNNRVQIIDSDGEYNSVTNPLHVTTLDTYPSGVGIGSNATASGAAVVGGEITFNADAQSVVIDATAYANMSLSITGTWSGTIKVQFSNKPSSGWIDALVFKVDTFGTAPGLSSITANGQVVTNLGGRYARLLVTAWTSGSAVVVPILNVQPLPAGVVLARGGAKARTDRSISVTTTAQVLAAANATRLGLAIYNDSDTDCWINFGATATAAAGSGNIKVLSGGTYETPVWGCPTDACSVIHGGSGNKAVTAWEL